MKILLPKYCAYIAIGLFANNCLIVNTAQAIDAIGGSARNSNVVVNSNVAWTTLVSVRFQNPTQRYCIATCSADALNPTTFNGPANQYRFTVSDSSTVGLDQGQERTLEFWNQLGVRDNNIKEITTTGGWPANANTPGYFSAPPTIGPFTGRTLYCLARKIGAAPNMTVIDASMTVTCTDNRLVPPFIIQPL